MLSSFDPAGACGAFGLVIAAALGASPAIAQAPPAPDLPPLSGPPVQPAQPAPPGPPAPSAPSTTPKPKQPGPGHYAGATPPGWMSPQEMPPGFVPYPYPYYYYPQQPLAARKDVDYRLPPPPPRRRNDVGMLAGGVVMVAAGLGAVIGGAVLVSTSVNRIDIYCDSPSFPCAHMDDNARKTGGALLMAGGALVGAAGIPLWIIGSKLVPLVNDRGQPGTQPKPALVPDIRVGAGTASVTIRF